MKNSICLFAALSIFAPLVLVGCKSDEEKSISYMEEMADIVDKDKDDCKKMGDDLKSWKSKNGDDMKKLKDKMKDKKMSEADNKAMMDKYKDRLSKIEDKMKGMNKCLTNSDVMDSLKDM